MFFISIEHLALCELMTKTCDVNLAVLLRKIHDVFVCVLPVM